MGTYYKVACDELREKIDPSHINNASPKSFALGHPQSSVGSVVVFAMLGRWTDCCVRLADDNGDDPGYFDYKDVTEEVLREYNARYGTGLKFTRSDEFED